jgi:hypoxanthine phosphoribosyltransferase
MEGEGRLILDPNDYVADCFRLAKKIWEDGYRPDFLVGLWRGGAPPGIAIQEYFSWKGHDLYHTAIRTQSLEGVLYGDGYDVKGLKHVIDIVEAEQHLLLVDDLFDTGRTMYEVIQHLRAKARRNTPDVKVAVVYYRPHRRRFLVGPDYYLHETVAEPVFPHRLSAMSEAEIREVDAAMHEILFS